MAMRMREKMIRYVWIWAAAGAMMACWANHAPANLRGQGEQNLENMDRMTLPRIQIESEVRRRYQDGSWSRYVRTLDREQSRRYLRETVLLIRKQYYRQCDIARIIPEAMLQMSAAVESEWVREQYPADPAALKEIKSYLAGKNALNESRNFSPEGHKSASGNTMKQDSILERLFELADSIRAVSQRAGLGAGWPDMELAASLAASLDGYSYMLTPAQNQRLRQQIGGQYRGIGIDLVYEGAYPTIFDVVRDSPAAHAGILPGDILTAVSQKNLRNASNEQIGALLARSYDDTVELTLMRNEQPYHLAVRPDIIDAPSIRHATLLPHTRGVGYVRVCSFNKDTVRELRREMAQLADQGMQSLIMDLRDNGGGLLRSGIEAARLFIRDGAMIRTVSVNGASGYKATGYDHGYFALPMVVLINEHTASAAEIFPGCLQKHRRAAIIGRKSLGKFSIQTIFTVAPEQMSICITTSTWFLSDESTEIFHGIIPDIVAGQSDDHRKDLSITQELSLDNEAVQLGIDQLKSNS
jgi:carboxyl-terminal processing protease